MEFCKAYNAATESQRGRVIPVEITVYEDRSFTFVMKTPPAAKLILKALASRRAPAAAQDQGRHAHQGPGPEIAKTKMPDLNATDLEAARRSSPAPPVPWASRSRAEPQPGRNETVAGPARPTRRLLRTHTGAVVEQAQQVSPRAYAQIDRDQDLRPERGLPSRQGDRHREVRRHRRGRLPPGCRPAQGRPDGPWHREPPARHR